MGGEVERFLKFVLGEDNFEFVEEDDVLDIEVVFGWFQKCGRDGKFLNDFVSEVRESELVGCIDSLIGLEEDKLEKTRELKKGVLMDLFDREVESDE